MTEPADPSRPAATDAQWAAMGREQFVSLGTYRKTGAVVATAVWLAVDGDDLVVTTEINTGKVKRLRNDPRVRLQPCSRMGAVEPGAPTLFAEARIAGPEAAAGAALRRKYGLQFTLFLRVEAFVRRLQKKPGRRTIIRISRPVEETGALDDARRAEIEDLDTALGE